MLEACVKYEMREPRFEVGGRSPILCTQCDSAYGVQSKRYGSLAYNHLKELYDLHYPKKYLIESESHPLLLVGTLTGIQRKEPCLLLVKNPESSVYSLSLSSWEAHSG